MHNGAVGKKHEINIWDLGKKINVRVNKNLIDFLNNKTKKIFKCKSNIHKELNKYYKIPFSTFKTRMKVGYEYFIDLEILVNLCRILNVPLAYLQSNIISYKIRRSRNYVEKPKLPIIISPIFDMLIAHHMADGFVTKIRGREPYFGYKQYNKELRLMYIKKIEYVFGKIRFDKNYQKTSYQVYCPATFTNLFLRYYSLKAEDFLSDRAKIPKEIYHKHKNSLLAILLAFIIDEGHIDSCNIVIRLNNRFLAHDIYRICNTLDYKATLTKGKDAMYNIYILKEGLIDLYKDYQHLKRVFPEVNLCSKEEQIEFVIRRFRTPRIRTENKKE
jgi:hypothetical protein